MKSKILVTGANGQLGKAIEELFAKNEDNLEFIFVTKDQLDITNKSKLLAFFKENPCNYCINCAAYTNVEQAEKTPELAYKVNTEGVKYLAEACKLSQIILIHISTDYVFDGEKGSPYTVDDLPSPINEYGKSKLLGEQHIQRILEKYFIIRTSWLYSKKYGKNFYRAILEKAKKGEVLHITNEQTGCPTNTESIAKYIIDLIVNKSLDYGIKHVSDNKAMTWFEFAEEILSENQLKTQTNLVKGNKYVTFARRPKNSVLNNSE
jgi:dTDP-4-dehydrorhamnose reductase